MYVFKHEEIGNVPSAIRMRDKLGKVIPNGVSLEELMPGQVLVRKVKKDGCILFFKNRYRVTHDLIGEEVKITVRMGIIKIKHHDHLVASYEVKQKAA